MEKINTLVIGAGVVGLAVGRAFAQAGRETIVLERESGIGHGVSSRNSEVIHAGLYYEPGSNKATLCVRGKQLLYELCAARGVSHAQPGKLIVATDPSQHAALRSLEAKALANGVPVLWLTAAEARAGTITVMHCRFAVTDHGHRRQSWIYDRAARRSGTRGRYGRA